MRHTRSLIRLTLAVAVALVWTVFYSSSSSAQKDRFGKPDTCRIVVTQDEKTNQVMASVSIFNDEDLAAMTLPFRYGNGKTPIKCDSIKFRKTRCEYFDMKTKLIDTLRQTMLIGLIADMSGNKPPMKKGDGEVARIYFTVHKGKKFQDFYMDTTLIKPFNLLKFVTPDVKGIYPAFDNSRALIKGGIPLVSPSEKKSEIPSKAGKEKEAKKSSLKQETLFEKKSRSLGIVIGTPADDVLAIRGKSPYPTKVVGEDANGLIVEWKYPDGIYIMRRSTIGGVTCYRVAEMKL